MRPALLAQRDGERERLLAGRAACTPEPKGPGRSVLRDSRRQDLGGKEFELRGVAKEIAFAHGKLGEHGITGVTGRLEGAQEPARIADAQHAHGAAHARLCRGLSVGRKDQSGEQVREIADPRERRIREARGWLRGFRTLPHHAHHTASASASASRSACVRKASAS